MRNAQYQNAAPNSDEYWMREALSEARQCLLTPHSVLPASGYPRTPKSIDVPVGAICLYENRVLARSANRRELDTDPTAHAEVLCLREAAQQLGRWNLEDSTLFVTLEPCPMCAGAIWLSRVSRIVFGAWDDKAGACGSVFDLVRDPRLNHRVELRGGVLEDECSQLLKEFFVARRSAS